MFINTVHFPSPAAGESLTLQFITKCQIFPACNLISCLEAFAFCGDHKNDSLIKMRALQSLFLLIWHVISSITVDAKNSICHSYWPASRGCSCCVIVPHPQALRPDLQRTVLGWQPLPASFSVKIIIMGFFSFLTGMSSVLLKGDSLE